MTTKAQTAIQFLQGLKIPEGRLAGKRLKLAKFQRQFVRGALSPRHDVAILCVGRGSGKTMLSAGLALGALIGAWDKQPRREVLCVARTHAQARIVWDYAQGLAESLPEDVQGDFHWTRAPYAEIRFDGDGGGHVLRCLASDGKNALGLSPTFIIEDERASWPDEKGDALEAALMTAAGKRDAKTLIISTSASNDQHAFSRWIDDPPPGTYVQEHRPAPGLPADDLDSLLVANPGSAEGIGGSPDWLQAQAKRAIARGGSALSLFRNLNRNERISGERTDMLLQLDEWLACETTDAPARSGQCIAGIDLGGSASMSAAALYWPDTGRLEAYGAFPNVPGLSDRGQRDAVGERYVEMHDRGELDTLGAKVVPTDAFLKMVMDHLGDVTPACFVADRYRQQEFMEAMQKAGLRVPCVWRGMGWKDGAADVERFRQAVFDEHVKTAPSLLLRSAFGDAVTVSDLAGNRKLAKARSMGRIDAAAATICAVAEGMRRKALPAQRRRAPVWA